MGFTWGALISTVAINVGICLLCFLIFGILRKLPFLYDFYHAKRNLSIPFRCAPSASSSLDLMHARSAFSHSCVSHTTTGVARPRLTCNHMLGSRRRCLITIPGCDRERVLARGRAVRTTSMLLSTCPTPVLGASDAC